MRRTEASAPHDPRDPPRPRRLHLPDVRRPRPRRRRSRSPRCPASPTSRSTRPSSRRREACDLGIPARHPVRRPREEGRGRLRGVERRRASCSRRSARSRSALPELIVDRRRLLLRVHRPRPLRRARRRRARQRRDAREPRARGASPTRRPASTWSRRRGMIDGFVGACRETLDEEGFDHVAIMAYSAKYASRLLRPVPRGGRLGAAGRRSPRLPDGSGQRRTRRSARSTLDVAEGADIVMVKPALAYLDVIARGRATRSTCRSPPTTSAASTR